jgi:hypothetical protein
LSSIWAERVDAELVQVGGDLAGAAADIRHRAAADGPHAVGEQPQGRAKVLLTGDGVARTWSA